MCVCVSCNMSACMAERVAGAGTQAKPVQQRVNEIVSEKRCAGDAVGQVLQPSGRQRGRHAEQCGAARRNYVHCCCVSLPCLPAAWGPLTSRWLMAAPAG